MPLYKVIYALAAYDGSGGCADLRPSVIAHDVMALEVEVLQGKPGGGGTAWQEQVSEEGDVFYYNKDTEQTTWERPVELDEVGAAVCLSQLSACLNCLPASTVRPVVFNCLPCILN